MARSPSSGSHSHARAAVRLAAIVGALLLVFTSMGQASSTPQHVILAARLTPTELTHRPVGVRTGARGTFSASFWPFGAGSESARYWLSTRRLTGPALTAHIHTGALGRNGPVLLTLCEGGRCNLSGASVYVYPVAVGYIKTVRLLGAYVDVHTKRNPRGELRGQIVIDE